MTIQSQLDQVLALSEKATPGEWLAVNPEYWVVRAIYFDEENHRCTTWPAQCHAGGQDNESNAFFIAAAVNFLREHGPAIRAAVGGVGETVAWWREDHVCHAHELTAANALADGYKPCVIKCDDCAWNASLCDTHGAVGGEVVAWMLRRKRDDFVRGCYATKPTSESLEFAELDGDYYTPLYASPPATVDVGATGPTCEAWAIVRPDGKTIHPESVRGSEHAAQWAIGEWPAMQKQGFTCRRITIVADELAAIIGDAP